jgi:hypothetical protein
MTAVTDLLTRLGYTRVNDDCTIWQICDASTATCAWPSSYRSIRLYPDHVLGTWWEADADGKKDESQMQLCEVTEAAVEVVNRCLVLTSEAARQAHLRRLQPGVN